MSQTGLRMEQVKADNDTACILIADDDPDVVESLKSVLQVENPSFEVLTAGNEERAREISENHSLDIALLDIRLGKKNGLDLVPLLKQRNRYIQCIMMTGYPDIQYAVNALRFGADDFLRKPIDAEHLVSTIKRYIKYQTFIRERDQAESWFRVIFQTSEQMLFITDPAGNIVQINDRAMAFCDVKQQAAIGSKIWSLQPWGNKERTADPVRNAFGPTAAKHKTRVEIEIAQNPVDKTTIEFLIRTLPARDDKPGHLLVEGRDITLLREKERSLQRRAYHDDLTGLPNRTQLLSALSNLCSIGQRRNRTFSVLFIDLDNFKQVNDTHGHGTGDQVLKQASQRLLKSVRGEDVIARYSGDEFIAVINEAGSLTHTVAVADRILRDMSVDFDADGVPIQLSVSIGIANFPEHGNTAEDLIHNADEAMYLAKRGGKNQYKILD